MRTTGRRLVASLSAPQALEACRRHPRCASIGHARPHPLQVSRTPRLLAHLFRRRSRWHDLAPYWPALRPGSLAMAVRLLSGVRPERTAQRHSRRLRPCPRRFRVGVAGLLSPSLASRLSGMARSAGLDGSEIRDVGARRASPVSRGQPVKYATSRPFADPEAAACKLLTRPEARLKVIDFGKLPI